MRSLFFILIILNICNVFGKEFSITNGRLKYSLTLNKYTRELSVRNYLSFKDMGSLSVLEEGEEGRSDNFIRDFNISRLENSDVSETQVAYKKLDKKKFFKCLIDTEEVHSYELIKKKMKPSYRSNLLLELDSCSQFLSSNYVFPDKENIFFFTSIIKKLEESSKSLVEDLFLSYLDINLGANDKFARESLLTMISYDTQFNDVNSIDLSSYKIRLKDEILLSGKLIKEDIESQTESIAASIDTSQLIKIVEDI
ncbi:hypothetical protein [Halobacteriovorax sp.]|uniref:hypothetical protein n=1 Tax=Halobacteriovorax sp. TaxID=2020862 RepID=UPI003562E68C